MRPGLLRTFGIVILVAFWASILLVSLWATVAQREFAQAAYVPNLGCNQQIAVSQTTSTDLKTFTNNGYICAVFLISATAQNISIVQGTGTTCGTSKVALSCGSTASCAVGAAGGFVVAMPAGSFLKTTTTGQHLCLLQDGSGNVSGFVSYVDAP